MTSVLVADQATCRSSTYRQYRTAGRKAKYGRFSVLPRPEIYRNLRIKDSVKIDPACGTGGFLTSTIVHMGSITTTEQLNTLQTTIFGWEKKPLPYLLAMTNLILHDIETPQIRHINSLNRPVTDYSAKDRVDVIVANPPFGGAEDDAVKQNFPAEFRTSETADLFLVLMMYLLKDKGRCGVVLPDGFMFGDGVKVAIKKRMLDEFGLHTIIRLPQVFKPYASVNTNLLFFQKGVPSRGVWFYRLDYPEGVKSFTKTRPMLDKHFDPVREWWADKQPIVVEGKDKARFFTVDELVALNYDFDKCCPFPHEEEEILEPAELIVRYQSERRERHVYKFHLQEAFQRVQMDLRPRNEFAVFIMDELNTETIKQIKAVCHEFTVNGDFIRNYGNVYHSILTESSNQSAGIQLADYAVGAMYGYLRRSFIAPDNYAFATDMYNDYIYRKLRHSAMGSIMGYGIREGPKHQTLRQNLATLFPDIHADTAT